MSILGIHHVTAIASVGAHPLPVDLGTVVTRIVWHERFHHDPGNLWLRKRVERIYRATVPQQATL